MAMLKPGLVHTPVTPFTADENIDFDTYGKLLEFHLGSGADSLAVPMHEGESVSLGDSERLQLLEFAVQRVRGRAPIIAHVSQSGTGVAADLASRAQRAGAAAVIATTPYYWTPPPAMLLEHFAQIGAAVSVPFYVYNAPEEMGGVKVTTDIVLKLIDKLGNFAGVVDGSLDWQFLIEVVSNARRARPAFQLLSGVEYMISASAIGADGMLAPMAGIAPTLVRELYDLCRKEDYDAARPGQEVLAALRQAIKPGGVAGLKAAMGVMGRECGALRAPLEPLSAGEREQLVAELNAIGALRGEPRGW